MTLHEQLMEEHQGLREAVDKMEGHLSRIKELNAALANGEATEGTLKNYLIRTDVPGRAGPLIRNVQLPTCKCGRPVLVLEDNQPRDTCLTCFQEACDHTKHDPRTVGDCPAGRWYYICSNCGKKI